MAQVAEIHLVGIEFSPVADQNGNNVGLSKTNTGQESQAAVGVPCVQESSLAPQMDTNSLVSCQSHPNMKCDRYCRTCKMGVCTVCTVFGDHELHDTVAYDLVVCITYK